VFRTNIALDMAFDDFADCDVVTREHVPLARRLGDPVVGVFAPFFKALQVVELDDQCRLPVLSGEHLVLDVVRTLLDEDVHLVVEPVVFGPLLGRDVAPEDGEGHCETSRFLVSMVLSHCRQFVAGVSWQRADRAAWPPARDPLDIGASHHASALDTAAGSAGRSHALTAMYSLTTPRRCIRARCRASTASTLSRRST